MAFGVVLFTLLAQGTTPRFLLERLGLIERETHCVARERRLGRLFATRAGLRRLEESYQEGLLLDEEQGYVCLRVQDNGRGITGSEVNGSRSFGLLGMGERVLLRSGGLTIQGTPGQGTTLVIRLPLVKGQEAL